MKEWKYIPVHPNLKAKVDAEDYDRVMKHKWRAISRESDRMKIVTTISTPEGPRQLTLGKFLMKPPKGKFVFARRYQGGFDYRKENLLVCTKQEMQTFLPKSKRREATSRYKGVLYSPGSRKWRARIRVDGELINLGSFDSENSAAIAYNEASLKYFGKNGYQNKLTADKKDRVGGN